MVVGIREGIRGRTVNSKGLLKGHMETYSQRSFLNYDKEYMKKIWMEELYPVEAIPTWDPVPLIKTPVPGMG